MYWRDSGLLHAVLNIGDRETLLFQPWVGRSWEGFVIEQILDVAAASDLHFDAYWFRTSDQYELDLVLDFGGDLWAIETNLTAFPDAAEMERLNRTADMIGASRRFLVTRTANVAGDDHRASCNPAWLLDLIESRPD